MFQEFIQQYIEFGHGLSQNSVDVANAYVHFNGSTAGKNKLYAHLQAIQGVTKHRQSFIGLRLKTQTAGNNENQNTMNIVNQNTMSDYQRMKLQLKEKEMEQNRIIKEKEALMKEKEIEAQRIIKEKEALIKEKKIEMQRLIEEKKIDLTIKLKEIDIAEKQKDREFIERENNKNRVMYVKTRHNKYLDLQVYGSPAKQYITQESLTDVLSFSAYNAMNTIMPDVQSKIKQVIQDVAKPVPVVENNKTKEIVCIDVDEVQTAIEHITQDTEPIITNEFNTIKDKVDNIKIIAIDDDKRHVETTYQTKLTNQDAEKNKTMKDKIK